MTATNYNIRIDRELRDRAFAVFESYGLAPAQAIKLFLNQVADTRTVPLSFDYNAGHVFNAAARQSLIEARKEFETASRYPGVEEAVAAMREIAGE